MIKRLFLFTMLACGLGACSDDENNPAPDPVGEAFTEGHIQVQMSLPDNPFFEMMQHIDYTAEDADEQAEEYYNNLTLEEQEEFMAFKNTIEGSGNMESLAYMLSLLFLPFQGTDIYVRDDEVTAKFDALTYHGENWIDMGEEGGLMYMESQSDPEKRITYTYRPDAVYESYSQVHVSDEFYHIEETGETELIAGYPCIKKDYTLINPSNNPARAYKLEVWTSEQMPVSLNFMHPYYLEEDGGVMKIVAYPTADEKYPTEYLFVKVTPRAVSDEEMAVQQVEPVYDYESDLETIGQKVLEIMFGG